MKVATGVDATFAAEVTILADAMELVVELLGTAEAGLVRENEMVAVGVFVRGLVVVGFGPVRVVMSVATPKENTLDGVLQHWSSPSP